MDASHSSYLITFGLITKFICHSLSVEVWMLMAVRWCFCIVHWCDCLTELCIPCEPGSYQDKEGQSSCDCCSAGFYSTDAKTSCAPCQVTEYSVGDCTGCQSCASISDCKSMFAYRSKIKCIDFVQTVLGRHPLSITSSYLHICRATLGILSYGEKRMQYFIVS